MSGTRAGAHFVQDPCLVRGFDHDTRTDYEITSSSLGAQDAIVGDESAEGVEKLRDLEKSSEEEVKPGKLLARYCATSNA